MCCTPCWERLRTSCGPFEPSAYRASRPRAGFPSLATFLLWASTGTACGTGNSPAPPFLLSSFLRRHQGVWCRVSELSNGEYRGKHWQMSMPGGPVVLNPSPSEDVVKRIMKTGFEQYVVGPRRMVFARAFHVVWGASARCDNFHITLCCE